MTEQPTTRVQVRDANGGYVGMADVEAPPMGAPHRSIAIGGKTYYWDARNDSYVEQAAETPKASMVRDADMPEKNPEAVHHTWNNPAGVAVKREYAEMDPPPAVPPSKMLDKDAKVQG